MKCKICNTQSNKIFSKKVLNKYEVFYYQCSDCDFIQTETPFWLDEAYSSAISNLDVGILSRNNTLAKVTANIIKLFFDKNKNFIDYGAGYGLFVRLMRDKGFNFFWQDKYSENLFASNYQCSKQYKYQLLTAFEVFEHLQEPISEIEKMFEFSDNILFSTNLQAQNDIENWWYIVPQAGQHISFYTKKALKIIAEKFDCFLYSDNNIHLLTKKKISKLKYNISTKNILYGGINLLYKNPKSLIENDFNQILNKNAKI